jgi:hypothetical protein
LNDILEEHSKTKEDTNGTEIQSSTSGHRHSKKKKKKKTSGHENEIDAGLEIPSVANSQVIFKPCLFLNILFLIYVATYLHVHDI